MHCFFPLKQKIWRNYVSNYLFDFYLIYCRYTYYLVSSLKMNHKFLKWMRYNLWFPLFVWFTVLESKIFTIYGAICYKITWVFCFSLFFIILFNFLNLVYIHWKASILYYYSSINYTITLYYASDITLNCGISLVVSLFLAIVAGKKLDRQVHKFFF